MKKLFIFLFILVLVPLSILTYLGVIPILSLLVVKPVDLGITADPSLVTAFEAKYARPNTTVTNLDVALSSQEITSVMSVWEQRDRHFPLHSVQVRFNADGTGEASGYLRIGTAIALAQNLGYSDADIEQGKTYIKYVSGDLPFYVKGTGGMTNNALSINPSTFQLGRVTIPNSITDSAAMVVGDMIKRRIQQIGGANIRRADFNNGTFRLIGTVPSTIEYK